MRDYSNAAMVDLTETDYETLLVALGEQLTAAMRSEGWPCDEAHKTARDTLAATWQAELTGNGWLASAGRRLGVDTSACVGA